MKETEYAFAVAKIRANEEKLLKQSDIDNLISADSYEAAIRILNESGFADFDGKDENDVLAKKQAETYRLLTSVSPDAEIFDFLIVKNDFHNIKAYLKALISGNTPEKYYASPSLISTETISLAFKEKKYNLLPDYISEAAKKGYDLITTTQDGQLLDIFIDRISLEVTLSMARKTDNDFIIRLAEGMVAEANIKIALRAVTTGKDISFLERALVSCSTLDKNSLIKATLDGKKSLIEYIEKTDYSKFAESLEKSVTAFEKAVDDETIEYIKQAKYQSFGPTPLIAYFMAEENEIKTVRIILSCKYNDLPKEEIKERVRVLYV